eukprot:Pgem_evm1s13928
MKSRSEARQAEFLHDSFIHSMANTFKLENHYVVQFEDQSYNVHIDESIDTGMN